MGQGFSSVVPRLPGKCKVLNLIPHTGKINKQTKMYDPNQAYNPSTLGDRQDGKFEPSLDNLAI